MVGGGKSKYFFARNRFKRKSCSEVKAEVKVSNGSSSVQPRISAFLCGRKREGDGNEDQSGHKKAKVTVTPNADLSALKAGEDPCQQGENETPMLPMAPERSVSPVQESPSSSSSQPPTPLEKQVTELKRRHPRLLLMIECGYRFRFFGEDAKHAADLLNIGCWK